MEKKVAECQMGGKEVYEWDESPKWLTKVLLPLIFWAEDWEDTFPLPIPFLSPEFYLLLLFLLFICPCGFPQLGMPVDVNSAAFRLWQLLNGSSFHGCIRNLYINNELQDFTKTQMKPGVVPGCEPCRKLYCLHGICQPNTAHGPVCHCDPGWVGPHCDQPISNPCQGHKWVCWNAPMRYQMKEKLK